MSRRRREKGEERREREIARARLTAVATFSTAPMADGAVVLQVDPWGPSDVSVAMLQSLIDDGLLCLVTDPYRPEWIAPGASRSQGHAMATS